MDNSAVLNFLSLVIAAVITTAGTILAAYISKGREKQPGAERSKVATLPGYVPSSETARRFWGKRLFVIATLVLVVLTIGTRWVLGTYSSSTVEVKTVRFASNNNPAELNPDLEWEAGSSEADAYRTDGMSIVITTGPHTWPNFPMINYLRPVTGNLSVQVTVIFTPEASVVTTAQMVGVLVRPVNARLVQSDASFPQDWLATSKYVTDQGILVGCRGAWSAYSANAVFLAIERRENSWRCAYSTNGINWVWNDASVDGASLQDKQLLISLFAYSDTEKAIIAEFSDWVILENDR